MNNQIYPDKKASNAKNGVVIKLMIMATSLVATVGGWAILAVGQMQNAVAAAQQPQPIVQPANPAARDSLRSTNSQTQPTQPQVTTPRTQTQPRTFGRTRSSR